VSAPALELEELEVRHGAVLVVRGLSLTVDRGEIVGLIGPNGAGKSSTLNAIMGAVRPAGGDVRLDGVSIVGRRPENVARAGIALVPEGRRIFAELTVEENLRLGFASRRARDGRDDVMARVYDLFPVVRDHRITHEWGGALGVPRDWHASVGFDRRSGIAWAGGYVGDGVATSNLAGRTLAQLIAGESSELTQLPWVGHRSRDWEPEPLRWLGVNGGRFLLTRADRAEARSGKPARSAKAFARFVGY